MPREFASHRTLRMVTLERRKQRNGWQRVFLFVWDGEFVCLEPRIMNNPMLGT